MMTDVPEELFDKIDVGHEHTTTAVARQSQLVHGRAVRREGLVWSFVVYSPR